MYSRSDFAFQGICCIEKQGLPMRLGKEGGAAAALLRNQLTFEHNSGKPLFHDALRALSPIFPGSFIDDLPRDVSDEETTPNFSGG
jgi:hypothetical protein